MGLYEAFSLIDVEEVDYDPDRQVAEYSLIVPVWDIDIGEIVTDRFDEEEELDRPVDVARRRAKMFVRAKAKTRDIEILQTFEKRPQKVGVGRLTFREDSMFNPELWTVPVVADLADAQGDPLLGSVQEDK